MTENIVPSEKPADELLADLSQFVSAEARSTHMKAVHAELRRLFLERNADNPGATLLCDAVLQYHDVPGDEEFPGVTPTIAWSVFEQVTAMMFIIEPATGQAMITMICPDLGENYEVWVLKDTALQAWCAAQLIDQWSRQMITKVIAELMLGPVL